MPLLTTLSQAPAIMEREADKGELSCLLVFALRAVLTHPSSRHATFPKDSFKSPSGIVALLTGSV